MLEMSGVTYTLAFLVRRELQARFLVAHPPHKHPPMKGGRGKLQAQNLRPFFLNGSARSTSSCHFVVAHLPYFGLYFSAPAHASLTYRVVKRKEYERIVNGAHRRKILNMRSPPWIREEGNEEREGNEIRRF